jgi:RNA polymerase sigma factor (TIGR02999 family)
MSDVTRILSKIEAGDPTAARELLPLVYDELRKLAASRMASERPDHTLQATALVHEAYMRLVGSEQCWEGRGHFFAAAANSMRQIMVNWAISKRTVKRGRARSNAPLKDIVDTSPNDPDLILDVDDALTQLAIEDAEAAEIVQLRLFSGLSVTEAGQYLSLSRTEAYERWQFARAWFAVRQQMSDEKKS